MTIQTARSTKVALPATATGGRKANLPFEHSDIEVNESVFVPGVENKKAVEQVLNHARRTYARNDTPKVDPMTGEQMLSRKGRPVFNKKHEKTFKMAFIEDGKEYGRTHAGKQGYALFRIA